MPTPPLCRLRPSDLPDPPPPPRPQDNYGDPEADRQRRAANVAALRSGDADALGCIETASAAPGFFGVSAALKRYADRQRAAERLKAAPFRTPLGHTGVADRSGDLNRRLAQRAAWRPWRGGTGIVRLAGLGPASSSLSSGSGSLALTGGSGEGDADAVAAAAAAAKPVPGEGMFRGSGGGEPLVLWEPGSHPGLAALVLPVTPVRPTQLAATRAIAAAADGPVGPGGGPDVAALALADKTPPPPSPTPPCFGFLAAPLDPTCPAPFDAAETPSAAAARELSLGPGLPRGGGVPGTGRVPLVRTDPDGGPADLDAVPPEGAALVPNPDGIAVAVDPCLTAWLRPHQRSGVRFLFECVTGLRPGLGGGLGCILADDMGLGKTLQGVTLAWTLLTSGHPALGRASGPSTARADGGAPWRHPCAPGEALARRVAVVCPASLVRNWEGEFALWLGGGPGPTGDPRRGAERCPVLALTSDGGGVGGRDGARDAVERFLAPDSKYRVLIASYETFRGLAPLIGDAADKALAAAAKRGVPPPPPPLDLLMCDEAHRLKNRDTATAKALRGLPCRRRVLLSGTPLQNDLDEFFSLCDLCLPGRLGTLAQFRRRVAGPVLRGREPDATDAEAAEGRRVASELASTVDSFVLRRTNALLSGHLPPKTVAVVCCRPSPLQTALYGHLVRSRAARRAAQAAAREAADALDGAEGEGAGGKKRGGDPAGNKGAVLAALGALKAVCNHPRLLYDELTSAARGGGAGGRGGARGGKPAPGTLAAFAAAALRGGGKGAKGAKGPGAHRADEGRADGVCSDILSSLIPPGTFDDGRPGRGKPPDGWWRHGSKLALLERLLYRLRTRTTDRVVVVSNYTRVLDLCAELCRTHRWPNVRLDGSTGPSKRQTLVDRFCDPSRDEFVFLLSSKAGGCGLNLVGANRLVLFDPDWNPASDKQAAARVWRDGQRRRTFEYRFLTAGTIEEKVFQRQLAKEGLAHAIGQAQGKNEGGKDDGTTPGAGTVGGNDGGNASSDEDLVEREAALAEFEREGESAFGKDTLRALFRFDPESRSDTYEQVRGRTALLESRRDVATRAEAAADAARDAALAEGLGAAEADAAAEAAAEAARDLATTEAAAAATALATGAGEATRASKEDNDSSSSDDFSSDGDDDNDRPRRQRRVAPAPPPVYRAQRGRPPAEDLARWGHHPDASTMRTDDVFRDAAAEATAEAAAFLGQGAGIAADPHGSAPPPVSEVVSFVFTLEVDGASSVRGEPLDAHGYGSRDPVAMERVKERSAEAKRALARERERDAARARERTAAETAEQRRKLMAGVKGDGASGAGRSGAESGGGGLAARLMAAQDTVPLVRPLGGGGGPRVSSGSLALGDPRWPRGATGGFKPPSLSRGGAGGGGGSRTPLGHRPTNPTLGGSGTSAGSGGFKPSGRLGTGRGLGAGRGFGAGRGLGAGRTLSSGATARPKPAPKARRPAASAGSDTDESNSATSSSSEEEDDASAGGATTSDEEG